MTTYVDGAILNLNGKLHEITGLSFDLNTGKTTLESVPCPNIPTIERSEYVPSGEWSGYDSLPTGNPIGDLPNDSFNKQTEGHLADSLTYAMGNLIDKPKKEKKKFSESFEDYLNRKNFSEAFKDHLRLSALSMSNYHNRNNKNTPTCDCGINKTYKNANIRMHSNWCSLRSHEK